MKTRSMAEWSEFLGIPEPLIEGDIERICAKLDDWEFGDGVEKRSAIIGAATMLWQIGKDAKARVHPSNVDGYEEAEDELDIEVDLFEWEYAQVSTPLTTVLADIDDDVVLRKVRAIVSAECAKRGIEPEGA